MDKTLYEPSFEHDNCGIGAVVNIDGHASRQIVDNALGIVDGEAVLGIGFLGKDTKKQGDTK